MQTPTQEGDSKTPSSRKKKRTPKSTKIVETPQKPTVDSSVKRRISDVLVTFHKYIQQWEIDNQLSFNTANTLCNLYSQWYSLEDNEDKIEELTENCKRKYYVKLAMQREDLLKQLKDHRVKMKSNLEKLTSLVQSLRVIHYMDLVSHEQNKEIVDDVVVVFTNWTAGQFYKTAMLILSMYTKEYILKNKLFDHFFDFRVGNGDDESTKTNKLTQCVSILLHQPYIEPKSKFMLDSMLVEAELK